MFLTKEAELVMTSASKSISRARYLVISCNDFSSFNFLVLLVARSVRPKGLTTSFSSIRPVIVMDSPARNENKLGDTNAGHILS